MYVCSAVDFETFSKILNRPGGFREPFDIEEYIRGFQVFDKDRSGFVGKGQIKYILTNLGEKMSEEEVDELFKSTIDTNNNEIDYRGTFYPNDKGGREWRCRGLILILHYRVRQDDCGELESQPSLLSLSFLPRYSLLPTHLHDFSLDTAQHGAARLTHETR